MSRGPEDPFDVIIVEKEQAKFGMLTWDFSHVQQDGKLQVGNEMI
jgi:hypothetical protein